MTYVLEWVDTLCRLLNVLANRLWNNLRSQILQVAGTSLSLNDLDHLLPNLANLSRASICSLLDLIRPTFGEGDGEDAKQVVIGSLDDYVAFNEGLPFAYQRAQLVGCEVQAVEVGQTISALDFVNAQLDLAKGVLFIFLQIRE